MINLKEAIKTGKINQFIKEHKKDKPLSVVTGWEWAKKNLPLSEMTASEVNKAIEKHNHDTEDT
jgi:uncharacterized protein YeaC (DUF1315 family)